MQDDEYLKRLGTLVGNLHALESVLRYFLLEHNKGCEPMVDIQNLAVGDRVPSNSFTNYDSLGKLVDKFNKVVCSRCRSYCVDRTVVGIRDMIAHGLVSGQSPDLPFELLKFGPERDGHVTLEHRVTLDECWLSSGISLIKKQIYNVVSASKGFGQNVMERR